MVIQFKNVEITLTIEELLDFIDTISTRLERMVRKQEDILLSNRLWGRNMLPFRRYICFHRGRVRAN